MKYNHYSGISFLLPIVLLPTLASLADRNKIVVSLVDEKMPSLELLDQHGRLSLLL
jgi:hypothetical protein